MKIPSAVVVGGAISIDVIASHKGRRFAERLRRVLVPDLRGRLARNPTRNATKLKLDHRDVKFETYLRAAIKWSSVKKSQLPPRRALMVIDPFNFLLRQFVIEFDYNFSRVDN